MVTYTSWLGGIVGKNFREMWKRFWNKYQTEGDGGYIGYATKKLINFPFEALQDMLIGMYNKFYWLTADFINQIGCNIGDSAMGKIDDALDEAKAKIEAKIAEAKTYIQDNFITPLEKKLEELKPLVDAINSKITEAENTLNKMKAKLNDAMTQVSNITAKVKNLNINVNTIKAQVDETIRSFNAKIGKLEIRIGDANTSITEHTDSIKDLYDRVKDLEGKTPADKQTIMDWIKEMLP